MRDGDAAAAEESVAVLDPNRNHADFILKAIACTGRRAIWARTPREALESGAPLVVVQQSALGQGTAMLQFIAAALIHGQHTIAVTSDRPSADGADAIALAAVAVVAGWWNGDAVARAVNDYYLNARAASAGD